MKLRIALSLCLSLLSLGALWLALRPGPEPVSYPVATAPAAPPAAPADEAPVPVAVVPPVEPPDATNLLYREPPPEALEQLIAHPAVAEAMERTRRQEIAAARFSQGVDEGNLEVDDLNRSVVSFFKTFELEPVLDDEAMMIGLEIKHIYASSPLQETDLVEGDLITRINDESLHDPAALPGLLEGLERDLSLCVDRDGSEVCQRLALD